MKMNLYSSGLKNHVFAILVFALITISYCWPILDGKKINQSDYKQFLGMSKEIVDFRLENGEEALWTNSMFGGMPAYQISVHYSNNILVQIDKFLQLYLPRPVGIIFLYFIGFYILLLSMRLNPHFAFLGALKLVGPTIKVGAKGTGVILSNVVDPALTGMTKVLASEKSQIPRLFRTVSKAADTVLTKAGIPRSDLWKYSEYGSGVKTTILRAIDQFTQNFKSGGPFNVQARNELKKLDGLNVTVPYKKTVIPYVDVLSGYALRTQSVNTISYHSGNLIGHNTDIDGFEISIKRLNYDVKNKTIIILGAGGVVPSIVYALKKMNASKIILSNRTKNKAEELKNIFKDLSILDWGEIVDFDMIINATSLGLKESDKIDLDFSKVGNNKLFYDIIYNPLETNFLKTGMKLGNKSENGMLMFIYQALESFKIWHDVEPKIDEELIKILKQ